MSWARRLEHSLSDYVSNGSRGADTMHDKSHKKHMLL